MKSEHKQFSAELKQITEAGEVEAVIATLNTVDKDGDIIRPGAFRNGGPVSIMPAHNHGSVPLGKGRIEERGNEAVFVGRFNLDVPDAKAWHSAIRFDMESPPSVQEWSFGFMTEKSGQETVEGEEVRVLEELNTFEVSPVLLGAGENTRTVAVKQRFADQIDRVAAEVGQVAERAEEIMDMRRQKGKDLSPDRKAQLDALLEKMGTLDASLATLKRAVNGEDDDDADNEEDATDEPTPEEQALTEQAAAEARRMGVIDTDESAD